MKTPKDLGEGVEDKLVEFIRKHYKDDGIVFRYGDKPLAIDVIPTGSVTLDKALGVGGYPKGRIIEIYGPESSGKTTLTLHALAQCQKMGGTCAFIDAEHALDPSYAKALGVNLDKLMVSQPSHGEQALSLVDMFVRSGQVDLVVVDSVAALVPEAELNGEVGDHHVGVQARMMSQAMRKLTSVVATTDTVVIFINQIRQKIGVMFGNNETTTGGNALKFYASVRLDIRRIGSIKKGDDAIGNRTKVKVVKNKVAPPFKIAEFDIMYGQGVSREAEIVDLAVATGLIKKAGAWYSYNGDNIGQGRDNTVAYLKENPEVGEQLAKTLAETG